MRRLLLISLLLIPALAWATACPSGYSDSKLILIPHQNVRSTLTSFPLLLPFNGASAAASFTLTDLKATGSGGKIQSSGNDIVFCDAYSGGNLLNFERVNWVSTTGLVEFWVSRTLSSSTDTPIWMFYGKAADSDHSSAAAVWSSYGMEVHAPDGSSLTLSDSTGTNTLTNNGATAQTSQIDGGFLVSATGPKWVSVADNASLKPTTGLTYSAWVYPTANVSVGMILTKNNGSDASGYDLYLGSGGSSTPPTCQIANGGSVSILRANANLTLNAWSYVVCTSDSTPTSNSHFKMYVNGAEVTSFSSASFGAATIVTNTTALGIGKRAAGTAFNGEARIDEPRVSNTALLSADWIAAEYYSQTSPNGFALMVDTATPAGMTSGAYCVPVTINHAKVPNTDQSNYPLLVRGTYPWMATVANGGFGANANGYDIRWFSDSTCLSTLNFQRIFWSATTGDSSWLVRVPTNSHTSDTTVYVSIGNAAFSSDASTAWTGSYSYVDIYPWGSPGSSSYVGIGSAALTLSASGSINSTSSPTGAGITCDGSTSVLQFVPVGADTIGAHGFPTGNAAFHLSMWVQEYLSYTCNDCVFGGWGKTNGTGAAQAALEQRATVIGGFSSGALELGSPTKATQGPGSPSTPNYIGDSAWHKWEVDRAANGDTVNSMNIYLDGQLVTSPLVVTGTNVPNIDNSDGTSGVTASVTFCRAVSHGAYFFKGSLGQIESSSVTRSSDMIATRYNNESSPWTFYSFGTAAPVSSSSVRHRVNRF